MCFSTFLHSYFFLIILFLVNFSLSTRLGKSGCSVGLVTKSHFYIKIYLKSSVDGGESYLRENTVIIFLCNRIGQSNMRYILSGSPNWCHIYPKKIIECLPFSLLDRY